MVGHCAVGAVASQWLMAGVEFGGFSGDVALIGRGLHAAAAAGVQ